jgi:hypothetical protein
MALWRGVASTHHHLAGPLVTAFHNIESLGEVNSDALLGTNAHHFDKLARDRVYIKRGFTAAREENDTALGTLGTGTCGSSLHTLRHETVRHRDGIHATHCQHAYRYVECSFHLLVHSFSICKVSANKIQNKIKTHFFLFCGTLKGSFLLKSLILAHDLAVSSPICILDCKPWQKLHHGPVFLQEVYMLTVAKSVSIRLAGIWRWALKKSGACTLGASP